MRQIATILILLTLAARAVAQYPDLGIVPYIERAGYPYSSICQIETGTSQGSGSLIGIEGDQALVLTCRHVADYKGRQVTCRWLWAEDQATAGYVAEVLDGSGYETDQALVICQKPLNVIPIQLADFDYRNGPWISAGFRGGRMRGIGSRNVHYMDGLIKLDSPYIGGMSGGPMFDRFGRQVAIVVASDFKTMGLSTNGPRLRAMIRRFQREH